MTQQAVETKIVDAVVANVDTGQAPPVEEVAKVAEEAVGAAKIAEEAKKARHEKVSEIQKLAQAQQARYAEAKKLQAERARYASDHQRVLAELDTYKKQLEAAEKDPLGYLESKGITPVDLADRIVKKGTPDEQIQKLVDKVTALERENETQRQAWQEREERAKQSAAFERAKTNLVKQFNGAKDKFASLHAFASKMAERTGASADAVMLDEFMAQVNRIKTNPNTAPYADQYSDEEVLESLDKRYEVFTAKPEPAKAVEKPAASVANGTSEPAKKLEGAKTLTNALASEASNTVPDDWDKWSDRQQNQWLAEQLRKGALPK